MSIFTGFTSLFTQAAGALIGTPTANSSIASAFTGSGSGFFKDFVSPVIQAGIGTFADLGKNQPESNVSRLPGVTDGALGQRSPQGGASRRGAGAKVHPSRNIYAQLANITDRMGKLYQKAEHKDKSIDTKQISSHSFASRDNKRSFG